jgi:AcrR family transcriptional regulator
MLTRDITEDGNETTRRLISAASEEFALHGFASARIRHIAEAAHANLAAVNYYFGGKEGLYRATLRFLSRQVPAEPSRNRRGHAPEDRLRRQVYGILQRYICGERPSHLGRILAHESMNPTFHIDSLIEDMMRPELERLRAILTEIAGVGVREAELTHAALAVMGQCLLFLFARPTVQQIYPGLADGPDACRRLARQIADFSLGGIARLKKCA